MAIFSAYDFDNHQQVTFFNDEKTGLKAIIAIHNTNLGPALGGCRFWNYSSDQEALKDVLRLSRGMTYKAAMAKLNLGGGKAVIIGDSVKDKCPEKLRAFGKFVDHLNGMYITAEDVGTSPQDMAYVYESTKHVVGLSNIDGGSGDPSVFTAYGVYLGIKASVKHKLDLDSLKGLKIAVQGLGHVGIHLLEHLEKEGAELIVTDINPDTIKAITTKFDVKYVTPEEILKTKCDVLSPCALGGGINDDTIDTLKCQIIAGAANNQLALSHHGEILHKRGILYAPDYVINAGGLINVTHEGPGYNPAIATEHVETIYTTLLEVFEKAHSQNIPTNIACDLIAEQRFNKQLI